MWWDCMVEINDSVTHKLLVMGWVTDETAWQKYMSVSLTSSGYWLAWYEITWDYLTKTKGSIAHILLVMGLSDFWVKQQGVVTTTCWSWDEMWWDSPWQNQRAVTHMLFIMVSWNLWAEQNGAFSQTVGYGMRHNKSSAQKWRVVQLTSYWSLDQMTWDCLIEQQNGSICLLAVSIGWDMSNMHCRKKGNATHFLLVMCWYVTILPVIQHYSLTVHDEFSTHWYKTTISISLTHYNIQH